MNQPKMWIHAIAVAAVVAAGVTGCSASSTTEPADPQVTTAKSGFWDAFLNANTDAIVASRAEMITALDNHPGDPELARWIGFSAILPLAAGGPPPDPSQLGAIMAESLKYTKMAFDLSSDPRKKTYNSDFYAGMLYNAAGLRNDQAGVDAARAMLENVVQEIPAFGYLSRGDIMVDQPKRTPDFALALESYFRFYEQCFGAKLDREHPDLSVVLKRPFADPDTTCTNWEHAPHGIQGALINFADSLVKAGKVDAARPVYAIVKQTEGFATWKYASVVDERLASDLAARAAAYDAPGDPRAQPRIGVGCFGCHQR